MVAIVSKQESNDEKFEVLASRFMRY